eukprot:6849062-Alexandrium_andersonii.AAC.1
MADSDMGRSLPARSGKGNACTWPALAFATFGGFPQSRQTSTTTTTPQHSARVTSPAQHRT